MTTKFRMKKDVLEKWLEAMRSGKYTKINHRLHQKYTENFCALGLLGEVVGIPREQQLLGDCNVDIYDEPLRRAEATCKAVDIYRQNDEACRFDKDFTHFAAWVKTKFEGV